MYVKWASHFWHPVQNVIFPWRNKLFLVLGGWVGGWFGLGGGGVRQITLPTPPVEKHTPGQDICPRGIEVWGRAFHGFIRGANAGAGASFSGALESDLQGGGGWMGCAGAGGTVGEWGFVGIGVLIRIRCVRSCFLAVSTVCQFFFQCLTHLSQQHEQCIHNPLHPVQCIPSIEMTLLADGLQFTLQCFALPCAIA